MRKLAHLVVILFCVGLGLFVMAVISSLMNADGVSKTQQEQIMHGRIESWVLSGGLWSRYSGLVDLLLLKRLYSTTALLMTVPLFFGLYYVLRIKWRRSLLTVGLMCLSAGALPYMCGRLALLYNTDTANTGPWLTLMLLGVFYAAAGCLFFTTLGLLFSNVGSGKSKASARVKKRQAIAASL